MAKFDQFAYPAMRGAARLNADAPARQLGKEWQHLHSPKRPAAWPGRINAVNLKITLGQVKADRGNLHADGSHFARECLIALTPWQLDAASGGSTSLANCQKSTQTGRV